MDVIIQRKSVREYIDMPVPEGSIDLILEAATQAPTARNVQPWLISAVTDHDLLKLIANEADHGKFIKHAPCCFAVFCDGVEKYYLEDGCAATMNIILSAQALGLATCWVAGDKKSYAPDIGILLNVPKTYKLISLIACGYPSDQIPKKPKIDIAKTCFRNRR